MNTRYLMTYISYHLHTFVRQYNKNKKEVFSVCKRKDFFDDILDNAETSRLVLDREVSAFPYIVSVNHMICYSMIKHASSIFIIGPIKTADHAFSNADVEISSLSSEYLESVPNTSFGAFVSDTLLLHNIFTTKTIDENTFLQSILAKTDDYDITQKDYVNIVFQNHENAKLHNPYDQEVRELNSVRNGDVEGLKRAWEEDYLGSFGEAGSTQLRTYQVLGIAIAVLASRAAIEAGVLPETAFSLVDSYCHRIENADNYLEAGLLGRKAEMQLTEMVRELNTRGDKAAGFSPQVNRCKNYIYAHLHDKLQVSDIASIMGLHPNYLAMLFKKYEGVTITDFIAAEKIKLVKNMLIYSSYTFTEIAYYLGYPSQSYLGRVFKKSTGLTLKAYRDTYGVDVFTNNADK